MADRMPLRRNIAAWLGLGLGVLGVFTFFVMVGLRLGQSQPALRDSALLNLLLIGVGLGLSAVGIRRAIGRNRTHRGRILAPALGALNLALAALFLAVLYPFALLPDATAAPKVGQPAPNFRLADHAGKIIELASLRGKNVVLVFYRGHW